MSAVVVVVVVAIVLIVFLKTVRITEGPPTDSVAAVKSAEARERIYGEARRRMTAEKDASKRPRADKLWARVAGQIEELSAAARAKRMEVEEMDLGVKLKSAAETFVIQVDYSEGDPEFLIWAEQNSTGATSGLSRVRQVRAMVDEATEWIQSQPSQQS